MHCIAARPLRAQSGRTSVLMLAHATMPTPSRIAAPQKRKRTFVGGAPTDMHFDLAQNSNRLSVGHQTLDLSLSEINGPSLRSFTLIRTFASNNSVKCAQKYPDVRTKGASANVIEIKRNHFFKANVRSARYLPQTGDSGQNFMPSVRMVRIGGHLFDECWARSNQ